MLQQLNYIRTTISCTPSAYASSAHPSSQASAMQLGFSGLLTLLFWRGRVWPLIRSRQHHPERLAGRDVGSRRRIMGECMGLIADGVLTGAGSVWKKTQTAGRSPPAILLMAMLDDSARARCPAAPGALCTESLCSVLWLRTHMNLFPRGGKILDCRTILKRAI
jgi:hypothetical protein